MGSLTIWHWVIVAVVLALLFLRGNLSDLLDDMARAIHAFRHGGLPVPAPNDRSGFRVRNGKPLLFIASAVAAAVAIWLVERIAN